MNKKCDLFDRSVAGHITTQPRATVINVNLLELLKKKDFYKTVQNGCKEKTPRNINLPARMTVYPEKIEGKSCSMYRTSRMPVARTDCDMVHNYACAMLSVCMHESRA